MYEDAQAVSYMLGPRYGNERMKIVDFIPSWHGFDPEDAVTAEILRYQTFYTKV